MSFVLLTFELLQPTVETLFIISRVDFLLYLQLKAATHVEYSTYRWPESSLNDLEARNEILRDFYKYGDVIMAYDTKAEKLDTIAILTALSDDSNCHLMMPIKFLSTRTVKCAYNVNELCAYNNKLLQQLLHSQLFHRPSKMTETREAADSFSINIQLCKHSSCIQLADEKELSGDEVFDEMRMEFEVNDTSLTALTVSMMLSRDEVTCGTDDFGPMKIIHTADVRFKNAHEKREKTIRKHSRGYNDEELIVASRWRPLNESVTDGEMAFDYFRNDSQTDFHMKLPESRDGKCVLSDEFYDSVRFNENSHTTCAVELTWDAKTNETLCQQLQQQILHFIFNSMNLTDNYTQENFASDVFVSQFWSPGMSVGLWTRIQVLNVPAWSPDVREVEKTSICSNVATSITFSFFSSRVRATRSRKYENVIERVTAEFGQVEELKYSMDDENQTETVEIQVRVQFFNVHETSYANNFVGALPLISSLSFISFLKNIL